VRESAEFEAGNEINGLARFGPAATAVEMRNAQGALGFACVAKANLVADAEIFEKCGRERKAGGCRAGGGLGLIFGSKPDASGSEDAAVDIAPRAAFDDGRPGLDRASAKFGPGDVHEDAAIASGFFAGFLKITDHPQPGFGIVMGAVDAHAIHAVADEVANELVVGGGVGGHSDHDADFASGRRRTEQGISVGFQELGTFADFDGGLFWKRQRTVGAQQDVQDAMNSLNGVEDVAFGAAKGRETEEGKVGLELADVVTAQGKIVGKISGTAAMGVMKGQRALEKRRFEFEHVRAKGG
jgi:hypothetical protein